MVEENKDYDQIICNDAAPYLNRLVSEGASFVRMFGEEHPQPLIGDDLSRTRHRRRGERFPQRRQELGAARTTCCGPSAGDILGLVLDRRQATRRRKLLPR